jgi:hypothetical protein
LVKVKLSMRRVVWFRPLTYSLVQAAPASAITMYVYERSLHMLMTSHTESDLWECYDAYDDDFDD